MAYGTPSGTTNFNPFVSELVLDAFERAGIPMPESKHIQSARRSANLVQTRFANRGVNLWKVDNEPYEIALTQGVSTFELPTDTVDMLDTYRRVQIAAGPPPVYQDIIMGPISRNEYAGLSNKAQQGTPTQYWVNRQIAPVVNVWPVADDNGPYVLRAYLLRQIQDANFKGGNTLDMPYRFLYTFTAELAADLALKWNPQKFAVCRAEADKAWMEASDEDREKVTMRVLPDLSGYGR